MTPPRSRPHEIAPCCARCGLDLFAVYEQKARGRPRNIARTFAGTRPAISDSGMSMAGASTGARAIAGGSGSESMTRFSASRATMRAERPPSTFCAKYPREVAEIERGINLCPECGAYIGSTHVPGPALHILEAEQHEAY